MSQGASLTTATACWLSDDHAVATIELTLDEVPGRIHKLCGLETNMILNFQCQAHAYFNRITAVLAVSWYKTHVAR